MKTNKLIVAGFALLSLVSCTQSDNDYAKYEETDITLNAPAFEYDGVYASGRSDGRKKTSLILDEVRGLAFKWTQGDLVGVFAKDPEQGNGGQLSMTMVGGDDTGKKAYFSRTGYQLEEGATFVSYYPLLDKVTARPDIPIDYLNQEQAANGSYSHLAKYDYLVSDPVTIEKTNTADFLFHHQGAILRLFIDMPEADTYSSVTLSTDDAAFTTKATMDLFNETEVIQPMTKSNSVTLNFADNVVSTTADNKCLEAWIMVSPTDFTSRTMTVTVKSATGKNDVVYTVNPGKNFVKGKAYQIKVPGDAVDHSKNPLLKWAPADLVYNKNTATSYIPEGEEAYKIQGSLYQWGRNIGWSDYKDAMGGYVDTNYGRFYEYATYGTSYKTGTGVHRGENDQNDFYYDQNDSFNEPVYFMNPNGTDYWIGSGGGSTWNERAKKCGFTTHVCPEGWRMPTKAEFLEIKPSAPLSGTGSLSSVINNRVELRPIDNSTCKYAIRWTVETKSNKSYLRIDALVVPANFSENSLSTIVWNTDKNVVTRYFGANGFIHAFYHVNKTSIGNFPVARPMPGTEIHTDRLWTDTGYANIGYFNIWSVIWDNVTDYSKNNEGYYWMSDEKTAFVFMDNTRQKGVKGFDGTYPFSNKMSVFGTLPTNAQDCCAIRCVKDN